MHARGAQGFIYINNDKQMVDPSSGQGALARNTNLNEDLGKVEYVFSDKTGTLTSNEMQLREVAVKGATFGDARFKCARPSRLAPYALCHAGTPGLWHSASSSLGAFAAFPASSLSLVLLLAPQLGAVFFASRRLQASLVVFGVDATSCSSQEPCPIDQGHQGDVRSIIRVPIETLFSLERGCQFWPCARRLEDHDELQGGECLSRFDKRLVAAIEKLKQTGRWEELVNDGGSPEAALRVSPVAALSSEVVLGAVFVPACLALEFAYRMLERLPRSACFTEVSPCAVLLVLMAPHLQHIRCPFLC